MTSEERAVIIGMWRQGASFELIAAHFGISASYVEQIVNNYLSSINKKLK